MRHITPHRIAALEPLLIKLRGIEGLVEKKPGVFYRKSRAFLHFHEHGDENFADVRLDGTEFARLPATTPVQQKRLLAAITQALRPASD